LFLLDPRGGGEPVAIASNLGDRDRINTYAWSPDGAHIVYEGKPIIEADGINSLYVVNADGSGQRALVQSLVREHAFPAWSPDGRWIAYQAKLLNWEVFIVAADGSAREVNLIDSKVDTEANNALFDSLQPNWDPDSRAVLYSSNRLLGQSRLEDYEIYRLSPDDLHPQKVAENPLYQDVNPVWSPQGDRFAFASIRFPAFKDYKIDVQINIAKGASVDDWKTVAEFQVDNALPHVWSPDGKELAVSLMKGDQWDIYVVTVDTGEVRRLTDGPGNNLFATWSPDGRWIAFSSRRDGNTDIYMMRRDGSELTRLTDNPEVDTRPIWSPVE
jgi:TolB protein